MIPNLEDSSGVSFLSGTQFVSPADLVSRKSECRVIVRVMESPNSGNIMLVKDEMLRSCAYSFLDLPRRAFAVHAA